MEITLEKIELVKDRTGVSYKEAKDALEAADGSVVDAIVNIEESLDEKGHNKLTEGASAAIEKLKEIIKKGNVSKILVKKDGDTILNLPVNIGILGTVIAPIPAVIGVLAAFGTRCSIEVVKEDGSIIDVSEMANDAAEKAAEKGSEIGDAVKTKSAEIYGAVKEKSVDAYEAVKDKAQELKKRGDHEESCCDICDVDSCCCDCGDTENACTTCDEEDCENCDAEEK